MSLSPAEPTSMLCRSVLVLIAFCSAFSSLSVEAQETLPFPPTPSASTAGATMQDSIYHRREQKRRLPADAPNILIILMDDVGPGLADTYGGEIHTPTLSRVAKAGISYNRFHSTAMCSPTRASLLTGRNHTHVDCGQIAELANDWDGFSGTIPKSSATIAEVLKDYGYSTAAFGKWHNTPATLTTSKGPFDEWPTGYGFEYFYGFLAGEASQYEPQLVRNTTPVRLTKTPEQGYHLTPDLAEDAIHWLREQRAFTPDQPFFMYWAPGAAHGPHQVPREWADKYKGKFDDGWDKYRERAFARQKELGWIPKNARLTERPQTLAAWDSIPEDEKPFQRRLMEVFAGFAEHADHYAGTIIDEIERQGLLDNTLIFYIWGDNGSSAEGQNGTIAELLAQNGIRSTVAEHIRALNALGGLDVLGSPKTDNMYHAGWAWAGSTPYRSTKLVGAHFGGIRQPMAVSWPKKVKADPTPRPQFHHVIDIAPTIYDVVKITPPRVVNGIPQDNIDGVSLAYTFDDASAKGQRVTQFFDIMGSRSIYHDGWMASAFGPRVPWEQGNPNLKDWDPREDTWELYNLEEDWTQADDLAAKMPEKLAHMKELFMIESARNKNLPIGGGLYIAAIHPDQRLSTPYTHWKFTGDIVRMPEFTAPKLGGASNLVVVQADIPENANGVLYALGGFSAGVTCYVKDGVLSFEYNLFEIERTQIRAKDKLSKGPAKIEVETRLVPGATPIPAAMITLKVNGKTVAEGKAPRVALLGFTANDCLDIGTDLGSPVSEDYYEEAPFAFNGKISEVDMSYVK
jgi:arylsulfatase